MHRDRKRCVGWGHAGWRWLVVGLASAALNACGESESTGASAGASSRDYRALEAILGSCGDSQSAVATALEGADIQVLLMTLDTAHRSCELAAQKLREAPIPGVDSEQVAGAIDQMNSGIEQITSGVKMMDRSPKKARTTAQAGMQSYKVGLEALQAARQ